MISVKPHTQSRQRALRAALLLLLALALASGVYAGDEAMETLNDWRESSGQENGQKASGEGADITNTQVKGDAPFRFNQIPEEPGEGWGVQKVPGSDTLRVTNPNGKTAIFGDGGSSSGSDLFGQTSDGSYRYYDGDSWDSAQTETSEETGITEISAGAGGPEFHTMKGEDQLFKDAPSLSCNEDFAQCQGAEKGETFEMEGDEYQVGENGQLYQKGEDGKWREVENGQKPGSTKMADGDGKSGIGETPDGCGEAADNYEGCAGQCTTGHFDENEGVCSTESREAYYKKKSEDYNDLLNQMSGYAKGGSAISSVFFEDSEWVKSWEQSMMNFFTNNAFGQLVSGRWSQSVCGAFSDYELDTKGGDGVFVGPDAGRATPGLTINVEKTPWTHVNESGTVTTNYTYKMEYYIYNNYKDNAGQEKKNAYNIILHDGGYEVEYWEPDKKLGKGSSENIMGQNMQVFMSHRDYDKACLELDDPITSYEGKEEDEVCNKITSKEKEEATEYDDPEEDDDEGSSEDPEVNDDV